MKKLDSKGFGVLEGLALLIILGLVIAAGVYVYKQNDNKKPQDSTTSQSKNESNDKAEAKFTYKLPAGWSEIKCDVQDTETNPAYQIAFPNNDKATNCEDRQNVVLIGKTTKDVESYGKCQAQTLDEINKIYKDGGKPGYESYKCEETSIGGVKVIVTESTQVDIYAESPGTIRGLKVYDFISKSQIYHINHYGSDSKGALSHIAEVDALVQSVKFD